MIPRQLESKPETLTLRHTRAVLNREQWRRFSGCAICIYKLMAYLEKGHTYEEVKQKLREKHPEIKYIDQYTRHAIRSATGDGIYDDYILEHNLWNLRSPVLTKDEGEFAGRYRQSLEEVWRDRAEKGRYLIENDRRLHAIDENSEEGKWLRFVASRLHRSLRKATP